MQVKAVTDRLAQKVSGIEKVLEGLHDDVGGMKSAVSAVEAALKVVKGELQSVDQRWVCALEVGSLHMCCESP
jgi:hypothetical protein